MIDILPPLKRVGLLKQMGFLLKNLVINPFIF